MKNYQWILVVAVSCVLSFSVGWTISFGTGVEPGFFEAPSAAGYGAGTEGAAPEGVSEEMAEYYKELAE
ncbi:MAG: hypothetical protein KAU29_04535 [Gammaproteobacteria bacterium]|nr:hypothetical protein [Gammaproteobacteria bacterium]